MWRRKNKRCTQTALTDRLEHLKKLAEDVGGRQF
jgi:hypothetical protein